MKTIKAARTTERSTPDKKADNRDVVRTAREIIVEYRETLESLAKSQAKDQEAGNE